MSDKAPIPLGLTRPEPGPVLVFAPHADDVVIGCGGTLALHAAQGDSIQVVVVFDGVGGVPDFDGDGLAFTDPAEVRRSEAVAAAQKLGSLEYTFWGFPEGHDPVESELVKASERVARCIEDVRPRTIYAPWVGESSIDHHALARAVRGGLARASLASKVLGGMDAWGYEVLTQLVPDRVVNITGVVDRKAAALMEHQSQILGSSDLINRTLGMNAHRSIYLEDEARYGEAFCRIQWEEDGLCKGLGGVA